MAVKKLELVPPPAAGAEPTAEKRPAKWDQVLIAAAGRYKALKKITDGGTAEIFLGEHVGAGGYRRLVILKRMHAALCARPELSRMLVEEAQVASQLRHGNIVEVRDLGDTHGRPFLVLELVDGWSLAKLLERARAAKVPMPPRVALHIAAEVARALQHAHDRGVVHCDICPHNILVSETGEVKLTDFGIARTPQRPVQQGLIAGKPSYMSPEQASGQELDPRTDVFSLGTVLYYALTDALPFKGGNDEEIIARVAKGEFESPTRLRPSLPKELGQLLVAAMRPEPWARYQTAHELLGAIETVLRSNTRSELERWLAQLYEADKQLPPTREKAASVVPLKVVRTPVTKRTLPRPSRKWLWAAMALAVLGAGATRAWNGIGAASAETVSVDGEPVVEVGAVARSIEGGVPAIAGAPLKPAEAFQPREKDESVVMGTARDVEVMVNEHEIAVEPQPQPPPQPGDEPVLPFIKVGAKVVGLYDQDRAMVLLTSEPEGADVVVDGRVLGATPVKLRFRTGIPFELTYLRDGNSRTVKWMTVERPKSGEVRAVFTEPKP